MMVAIQVVNIQGEKVREIEVDVTLIDSCVRKPLLKEALIAYNASQRQGSASTKTRSEVRGGTTKPWRQKGTGRARQGSIRSPQFVGGGRAHGPRPRDFGYSLPRKQRALAKQSAIRVRAQENTLIAVEGLEALNAPKTKTVTGLLSGLGLAGKGVLLVSEVHNSSLYLSARNVQKVDVAERRNLCAGAILRRPNLVFSAESLDALLQEAAK